MYQFPLSEHFTLADLTRSAYAVEHGIDNSVPSQFIPRLEQLCKCILEPLHAYVASTTPTHTTQPLVTILAGYLSPILNLKVGGLPASQHTLGEAVDISLPLTPYTDWDDNQAHTDMAVAHRWVDWLEQHTDFDQLVLQTTNGRDYHLHISCRKNLAKNRHQVLRNLHLKTEC